MEQNFDDITQSFEVIDRKELVEAVINEIEDESNNNNKANVAQETNATPAKSSDDNNNQSTSPLGGNKKYTRDELIKLKSSMERAEPALTHTVKNFIFKENALDNTLDRTRPIPRGDAVERMMPSYMPNMPANRNSYRRQGSNDQSGRRSQQGNRSQSNSLIKVNLTSNEDIKLNEAKNAWKPQALVSDLPLSEEEKKKTECVKGFRSILNKITPENFSTLIQQLKVLQIDSVDILDSCISLVFEKAIMEPAFGMSYALLCKEVSDVFVVPLDENNAQQNAVFKKRLITQCQREFEKHRDSELVKNNAERLKEIEDEEDEKKKEELKANYEMESYKIRRRAVGTVHFIGELYKIEMLTSRIMQSCISHLLDPGMCSEETLECLCKLLTTIGKRLEKMDLKKIDLSECFVTLTRLADKKNPIGISSRIRFMIQDLIDLRLNNWTPRMLQRELKPLTMDEIKKQAEKELYLSKLENRDSRDRNDQRGFNNNNNNKNRNGPNEDGWSTQYSKSRPLKLDMNKLSSLHQASTEISLGGVPSFQNFSTNRFQVLKEDTDPQPSANQQRPYGGRFSGGSGGGGGGGGQNQNRNSYGNNNNRGNRNNNNNNNNPRSPGSRSLQPPMMPNNKQYGPQRKTSYQPMQRPDLPMKTNSLPRKISAPARPMTDRLEKNLIVNPEQVSDAMKKSLKSYMDESITMNDVTEKLNAYRIAKEALVMVYNWVFDQHDKERFLITDIICECVARGIINPSDLLEALQEIIEFAQELVCDLPHVYNYIGQLAAAPLRKHVFTFGEILNVSKKEIEANNGATVLKNVLKVLEQKYDKTTLSQLYFDAGIDFQSFLGSETNLSDFLKENNFDYLMTPEPKQEPLMLLDESTRQKIQEMLKDPDTNVDKIISWIESNIKDRTDKGFVRSLTDIILEECIEKTLEGYSVNQTKSEKFSHLLTQFLDMKTDREIQCLHVIKRKIVDLEHPSGCLQDILTCLYDNFALSKQGFWAWRDDNDPQEQEGKGVALKSCTAFIKYLKEEGDEDSTGEEN